MLLYSALWLPTASPTDFLVCSLSLWELFKVVLWSKVLGMSSALYLVAVLGDLAVALAGVSMEPLPRSKIAIIKNMTVTNANIITNGVEHH